MEFNMYNQRWSEWQLFESDHYITKYLTLLLPSSGAIDNGVKLCGLRTSKGPDKDLGVSHSCSIRRISSLMVSREQIFSSLAMGRLFSVHLSSYRRDIWCDDGGFGCSDLIFSHRLCSNIDYRSRLCIARGMCRDTISCVDETDVRVVSWCVIWMEIDILISLHGYFFFSYVGFCTFCIGIVFSFLLRFPYYNDVYGLQGQGKDWCLNGEEIA